MTDIPGGYKQDAKGNLIPIANIKPQHLLEDELVKDLSSTARMLRDMLKRFKNNSLSEVMDFRGEVAHLYGAKKGGAKGNMVLRSFDGSCEVQIAVADNIAFGAELMAAKELVDNCLERWSEGSNNNIKVLINDAFKVNKAGRIDVQQVLGLRKFDMDGDEEWGRAMEAISDAVRVTSTRTYIRFYEIDPKTRYKSAITLDLAAL